MTTTPATDAPARPGLYLAAGDVVAGRYVVTREIGRGGHSVVYAARDRDLGADVALKLLVPPPAVARLARERLRREVQAVRGLAHEHVAAVHDLVEDGERSVLVMELVDGPDLERRVRERGPLAPDGAAALGREVADALSAAHRRGILHRDVKPSNVLLEPRPGGQPSARLTDFGSARLDGQATLTETGALVGTLCYVAPEVLAGARADARAEVYALGMTLHFTLTGRLPDRPSRHLPPPPAPDGFRPSVALSEPAPPGAPIPAWLDAIVARATAADPRHRFPTAAAMAAALAAGDAGAPLPVLHDEPPHPTRLPIEYLAFCGGVGAVGLVVGAVAVPAFLWTTPAFVLLLLAAGARRVA
ncbi:MAG: serine/threonine-protein kinase, partial [Gemmatimonadaceae bacterium]